MWHTIEANEQYYSGWTLVRRTKLVRSGLQYTSGEVQTGVRVIFAKLPKNLVRTDHGSYQSEPAEAIIPVDEVTPDYLTQNCYLQSGTVKYRIMEYDDFGNLPWLEIYGLKLERVEDFVD